MYEIFKRLLAERGLNTADVCRATGISQSTLSNWKKRNNILSPAMLQKIADFFGVTLDYMMGKTENHVIATVDPDKRDRIALALANSKLGMSPGNRSENAYISGGPILKAVKSGNRGIRIEVKQPEFSKRTQDISKIIESLDESDQEIVLNLARRLKENHQ